MKLIKGFKINDSDLGADVSSRNFTVFGDNNSVFSLQVKASDGRYYDFSSKTFTAATVYTSSNRLTNVELIGGSYTGSIIFPADADGETYTIYLWAEPHFETELSESLSSENPVLYTTTLTQVANVTLTIQPIAATAANYDDATIAATETSTKSPLKTGTEVISFSFTIANKATDAKGYGLTQKKTTFLDNDFYASTTAVVDHPPRDASTSHANYLVEDNTKLAVGMTVTGVSSGSISGTPILTRVKTDKASRKPSFKMDQSESFADNITITFKGHGSEKINKALGCEVVFSELKFVPTVLTTTVRGDVGSTTVTVNGTYGISKGAYIEGFGVDNTTDNPITAVTASSSAGSITTTTSQSLADGSTLTIVGSTNTYTLSGKVTVKKFPIASSIIYLDLDKLLEIGTAS